MPGKPHSRPQPAFFASDKHGGLRIAAVCAVVAVAALDSILTALALGLSRPSASRLIAALAPASV